MASVSQSETGHTLQEGGAGRKGGRGQQPGEKASYFRETGGLVGG